jgi:hypothetical protein
MKQLFPHPIFFLLLLSFWACEEIEQDELDKRKVVLTAPTDQLITTNLSHTFLWEEVEKAEGYVLQIAQPSFKEIQQFVLNVDLPETTYDYTLAPGIYEWRVKAYNNISETDFTTYTIKVDSSLSLSGAKVILVSPAAGFVTSNDEISFSWQSIDVATTYRVEIRSPNWDNGARVFDPIFTSVPSISLLDFDGEEGDFAWAVQAENDFSKSVFSDPRSFTIDFTAPATPGLTKPIDNAILNDSVVQMQWVRPGENGSPISDSVFIYTDQNETNLIRSALVNVTSLTDTFNFGTYYWKVRSYDAAGNKSAYSISRSFRVQ